MVSDRFDRFLPFAGVLAGVLLLVGLVVLRNDPSNEKGVADTFAYWQADRGKHQLVGMVVTPLIAFLLVFFGAELKRRLGDAAHGLVAFGGALLAAGTFVVVGMLEAAMTSAAKDGHEQAVYTLNQFHSYDWLGWNAAFAAVLLATGLGARRNGMLPVPVAWATIVLGVALLTPAGFFGFIILPVWLIVVGLLLSRGEAISAEPVPGAA